MRLGLEGVVAMTVENRDEVHYGIRCINLFCIVSGLILQIDGESPREEVHRCVSRCCFEK